jgi:uncharacterized membrane protein YdjX (TVP38/TMEM64 family)
MMLLFRTLFAILVLVLSSSIETGCGAFVGASSRPARIHDSRPNIVRGPNHAKLPSLSPSLAWQLKQQQQPFEDTQEAKKLGRLDVVLSTRGGAKVEPPSSGNLLWQKTARVTIATSALLLVTWYGWMYRVELMRIFNKDQLQAKTLQLLSDLDDLPKLLSYSIYMFGMAFWELMGLSTIPVETAAGMVFGWSGFLLSGTGKLLGALAAFGLGRHSFLASFVQRKLQSNTFLQLVEEQTKSHPFRVLLYLKCSCFPETIKNFGAAVLLPIRLWMFALGTMMHGWTFSALWTFLGVDSAKRLINPNLPVNGFLNTLLVLSIINGIVVSPLAMGFWIKGLKETSESKKK